MSDNVWTMGRFSKDYRIKQLQAEVNGAHEIILSERAEVLRLRERIEKLEAENRHLRIMLDSYGRLSTDKARLTKLREYIQTKTRATQVKGQADAD